MPGNKLKPSKLLAIGTLSLCGLALWYFQLTDRNSVHQSRTKSPRLAKLQEQIKSLNLEAIHHWAEANQTALSQAQKETLDSIQMDLETVNQYLEQAKFPPYSRPILNSENDPIASQYDVSPTPSIGNQRVMTAWPEKTDFVFPEPIVVFAKLESRHEDWASGTLKVTEVPSLERSNALPVFTFQKVDANCYRAEIHLPVDTDPIAVQGNHTFVVELRNKNGDAVRAPVSFTLSTPMAALTGRFRDRVDSGSLIIEAEIDIQRSGRYHLEGSLYSQGNTPLLWSENALQLEKGIHWMPLKFYGLTLREKNQSGPFLLKFMSLSRVDIIPNMKAGLMKNSFTTHPYEASLFTHQPFNDPDRISVIQRLIRDLEDRLSQG